MILWQSKEFQNGMGAEGAKGLIVEGAVAPRPERLVVEGDGDYAKKVKVGTGCNASILS